MAIIENDTNNSANLGGATPDNLAQRLSMDKTTIVNKLVELTAEGHIEFNKEIELAFLTDRGRQLLTDLKYKSKNIGSQNIIFNAPVNNSNIIQGDNASAIITVNFLNALQQEIEKSTLSEEEKKTWLSRIKEISSHPIIASLVAKALEMLAKSQIGG